MANKANNLAHTKWMCKYHIVFTPKYRRKIIYNQYKSRYTRYTKTVMCLQRSRNLRRTSDARSYPYVSEYPT